MPRYKRIKWSKASAGAVNSHPNSTKLDYLGASNVRFETLHGKRFERKDRPRAEDLFARVGSSLIAVSYHTYYGVPGIESRAFLPEGRVPGGRAGGSEEGNHGL